MFLYIVYGLLVLVCIYGIIVLMKEKNLLGLFIPFILFLLSLSNFWSFAKVNILSDPCEGIEGCMKQECFLYSLSS